MAPTTISPNVDNYQVGKGIVSFRKKGDSVYRDLGNVSSMVITPDMTTLEHFSSRSGVKKKDKTVVIEKKSTVVMTLEEFTPENVAMMLLGATDMDAPGGPTVEIFSENAVEGALRFVGTNEVGPTETVDLYNVSFLPNNDFGLISEEWNTMELSGDVLVAPEDDADPDRRGKFGIIQFTNMADAS